MGAETENLYAMADDVFARLSVSGYEKLSDADKIFVSVWSLKGEVDNGGFEQWLFNTSGDWAYDTTRCLIELGATRTAELVSRVLDLFPAKGIPSEMVCRRKLMERIDKNIIEMWDEMSDEFFKEEEDIESLLADYVLLKNSN